jgi:hypothetical protein
MKHSIIQPPTKEILALCNDADLLIEHYLACLGTIKGTIRRFEAEAEVYTILKLILRHLEAVCELARQDLVLLPSAIVLSRAAFEASIRGRWMLRPIDPYEREVRWVMHLRSATEHFTKLERNKYIHKELATAYGTQRESFEEFDTAISKLLSERGYTLPKQAPNLWEMLKEIEEPRLYQFYITLSAYTHTNFEAGTLYRKNLGTAKKFGEFITAQQWHLPLEVAWSSFFLLACDFLYWVEADMETFSKNTLLQSFQLHLSQLNAA